jgi:shikimate dehydrogenase
MKKKKVFKNITGILGYPLSHTFSPAMHNNSFKFFKMDWEYKIFEMTADKVRDFMWKLRKESMKGINVTIPHKQFIMQYMDKIDSAAEIIGAVNTVVNDNGVITGYNTDYLGFVESLKKEKVNLKNKKVVMIGSGGAAHAIGYAVNTFKPKQFYIYNIDIPMTAGLVKQLKLKGVITGDITKTAEKDEVIASADFIVNCTSVGMHNNDSPYKIDKLKKGAVVFDVIYNPAKTEFLKRAEKLGAKIINGLDMLIFQGIESFYLWTGKRPKYALVKKSVEAFLRKKK